MDIVKAIIPAGGLGTRFGFASQSLPKEMLPVGAKPAIQYVVEEGYKSGIKDFVMVTKGGKASIENHFDFSSLSPFSQKYLIKNEPFFCDLLKSTCFSYIRQKLQLGLGDAILSARNAINDNYFSVMLPDDIIHSETPALKQLLKIALQEKCSIIAVQEVDYKDVSSYGIVSIRRQFSPRLYQIKEVIEKPDSSQIDSNLAIIGRYILTPKIFPILENLNAGKNNEIQLTDAIQELILSGEKVFAYRINDRRYDVGTPLGLIKASIEIGLKDKNYGEELLGYLRNLDKDFVRMQMIAQEREVIKEAAVPL